MSTLPSTLRFASLLLFSGVAALRGQEMKMEADAMAAKPAAAKPTKLASAKLPKLDWTKFALLSVFLALVACNVYASASG